MFFYVPKSKLIFIRLLALIWGKGKGVGKKLSHDSAKKNECKRFVVFKNTTFSVLTLFHTDDSVCEEILLCFLFNICI